MDAPFHGLVARDDIIARIRAHPLGDEPALQRAAFDRLMRGQPTSAETQHDERRDASHGAGGRGTVVYLHGGGYVFGSPQTHARIGQALHERTAWRVLLPAYPLAPERVWPAQLDAVLGMVRGLPEPVVLAGDSAGGHLALVTALELARQGRSVAGLLLFSPNTDRSGLSRTRLQNDPLDPMVNDAGDRKLARLCFGNWPADHPQASPALDDLTLLPPTYIEVGGEEVLLGDSLVLAERARHAGVDVTLRIEPDGLHMGQAWAPWWPVAAASLDRAAAFVHSLVKVP